MNRKFDVFKLINVLPKVASKQKLICYNVINYGIQYPVFQKYAIYHFQAHTFEIYDLDPVQIL